MTAVLDSNIATEPSSFQPHLLQKQTRKTPQIVCFKCRLPGHIAAHCRSVQNRAQGNQVICSFCKKPNHSIERCFAKRRSEATLNKDQKHKQHSNCILTQVSHDSSASGYTRFRDGKFLDCNVQFLVDSGSTISLLSNKFVRENQLLSAC